MLLQLTPKLQIVFVHEFWAAIDAELRRTLGPKLRTGDSFHMIDMSKKGHAAVGTQTSAQQMHSALAVLEQLQPTCRPLGRR